MSDSTTSSAAKAAGVGIADSFTAAALEQVRKGKQSSSARQTRAAREEEEEAADDDDSDDGGAAGGDDDLEADEDKVVSLKSFSFKPTYEAVMSKEKATELWANHLKNVKSWVDKNNADQYLIAVLIDMALNGSSNKRTGDNWMQFGGHTFPTSYLVDIGTGEKLRRFGRYHYGKFKATISQQTKEASEIRRLLAVKWGVGTNVAVYCVDFVDMMKVEQPHKLFAKMVAVKRTEGGDAAALQYIKQVQLEAAQAGGGGGGGAGGKTMTSTGQSPHGDSGGLFF